MIRLKALTIHNPMMREDYNIGDDLRDGSGRKITELYIADNDFYIYYCPSLTHHTPHIIRWMRENISGYEYEE